MFQPILKNNGYRENQISRNTPHLPIKWMVAQSYSWSGRTTVLENRRVVSRSFGWHPHNWSIKTKLVAVNLVLSMIPVTILTFLDNIYLRERLTTGNADRVDQVAIAAVVASAVVVLLLSALIVSRITNPVHRLVRDLDRIAKGDLSSSSEDDGMFVAAPPSASVDSGSANRELRRRSTERNLRGCRL